MHSIQERKKDEPDDKAKRCERLEGDRAQSELAEDSRGAPQKRSQKRERGANHIRVEDLAGVGLRRELGKAHEVGARERDSGPQPEIAVERLAEEPPCEEYGDERLHFLQDD